jgi:hypothetical protein
VNVTHGPRIRANWTHLVLNNLKSMLPKDVYERIRARVPARSLSAIEQAGTFEWIDGEHQVNLVDAGFFVLGAREHENLWRRMTAVSFERPVFRTLVRGTATLFGSTPATFVKKTLAPAWGLVATGFGEFVVVPADDRLSGRVHWIDVPPLVATPSWIVAWRGALHAFIDILGRQGEVRADESKLGSARAVAFDMRWS